MNLRQVFFDIAASGPVVDTDGHNAVDNRRNRSGVCELAQWGENHDDKLVRCPELP
jgi:hypothetical protein